MKKRLLELFTEPDNKTLCPVRLMSFAGCVEFLTLSGWHVYHTMTFDVQAYAIGLAALLGGIGAALGLKKDAPSGAEDAK